MRIVILLFVAPTVILAECADAGICRLTPASETSTWRAGLRLDVAAGKADEGITYRTATASVGWTPAEGWSIDADLPLVDLSGRRGQTRGLGDAQVRLGRRLAEADWGTLTALSGVRLPTGDDQAQPDLPQGYQTGLGGVDLLGGFGWTRGAVAAGIAYARAAPANALPGVHLARGDDLAVHLDYGPAWDAWRPSIGLVAIARLGRTVIDDGRGGRIAVAGSDTTQVNARMGLGWAATASTTWQLTAAVPLRSRPQDQDGLARRYGVGFGVLHGW